MPPVPGADSISKARKAGDGRAMTRRVSDRTLGWKLREEKRGRGGRPRKSTARRSVAGLGAFKPAPIRRKKGKPHVRAGGKPQAKAKMPPFSLGVSLTRRYVILN
jgi:hypothetical protein